MLNTDKSDLSIFSGKVRVRVCGLLIENDRLLLIRHDSIGPAGYLWAPPGGGLEFGQSLDETLAREFLEETNLSIEVGDFLFVNEYIGKKHHAIELFYKVQRIAGSMELGKDPELHSDQQILSEIRLFTFEEIDRMQKDTLHNMFREVDKAREIFELRGLISFRN